MKIANGMEFVNDESVIGKWEYIDIVDDIKQFNPFDIKNKNMEKGFKEIYFLPDGKGYWIFEGWTKGHLVVHYGGDDPILTFKYSIKNIFDCDYIFIEVNNDDGEFINVLKKVSSNHFKTSDFVRKENIDLPFEKDEKIIGKWKAVAYVENVEDFPQKVDPDQVLWLEYIVFNENGLVARKYFDQDEWIDKWTKGCLLDVKKSVCSKYIFKNIDGVEYMFLEWKMGNYIYAGKPETFYVFMKEKQLSC